MWSVLTLCRFSPEPMTSTAVRIAQLNDDVMLFFHLPQTQIEILSIIGFPTFPADINTTRCVRLLLTCCRDVFMATASSGAHCDSQPVTDDLRSFYLF